MREYTAVWITAPNITIYDPLARELKKFAPHITLTQYVPMEAKRIAHRNTSGLRFRYFQSSDVSKMLFSPIAALNVVRGMSNYDLFGTGIVAFRGLADALSADKPTVVIINGEYNLFLVQAVRYCRKHNIPYIVQTETQRIDSRFKRILLLIYESLYLKRAVRAAQLVEAWSTQSAKYIQRAYNLSPKQTVVLPAGVPIRNVRRDRQKSSIRLLIAGRLVPYKNVADAICALKLVNERGLSATLSVVGSGPELAALQSLVLQMGLQSVVQFVPRVDPSRMQTIFRNHDVLVLPSYNEAIGMVVPQALSAGLPTIVSDTSGAAMYVQPGVTGYVFRTADVHDLANKILLLKKASVRERMSRAAVADMKKRYSLAVSAQTFAEHLDVAIGIH